MVTAFELTVALVPANRLFGPLPEPVRSLPSAPGSVVAAALAELISTLPNGIEAGNCAR